jgi:hypothetical protein
MAVEGRGGSDSGHVRNNLLRHARGHKGIARALSEQPNDFNLLEDIRQQKVIATHLLLAKSLPSSSRRLPDERAGLR